MSILPPLNDPLHSGQPGFNDQPQPSVRAPYVSIDIETTGLDETYCQVIEIGAVIDDWVTPIDQLPRFHSYVVHDKIIGEPYALAMNAAILRKIANRKDHPEDRFDSASEVMIHLMAFLGSNGIMNLGKVAAAGKNFDGFDRQFLKRLPNWHHLVGQYLSHRSIDPGMKFYDPSIDQVPPSTQKCMERAHIPGEVAHTAIEDALTVIKLIRYAAERDALLKRLAVGLDPANPGAVVFVLGSEPKSHLDFEAFHRQFYNASLGEPYERREAHPGAKQIAEDLAKQFQERGQFTK